MPARTAAQAVDWEAGTCAGSMTATNVPGAKSSVTTCWEGEIINDRWVAGVLMQQRCCAGPGTSLAHRHG